jgi:acyl carrier protein
MQDTKETLRSYILKEFLPGERAENLRDETPLLTSGILDSVSTLKLVSFIEQHFGILIEAHEAGVEHFDTIETMAKLIDQKR